MNKCANCGRPSANMKCAACGNPTQLLMDFLADYTALGSVENPDERKNRTGLLEQKWKGLSSEQRQELESIMADSKPAKRSRDVIVDNPRQPDKTKEEAKVIVETKANR